MYRRAISGLLCMQLLLLSGAFCVEQSDRNLKMAVDCQETEAVVAYNNSSVSRTIGIADGNASAERYVAYEVLEKEPEEIFSWQYELSDQDYELLLRIVEAEAGGEDEDGKLLVANVILNRMENKAFPDTISEVILQQNGNVTQFSPVADGRIWEVSVSEQTVSAVERALCGEDLSRGALYFAARKYADSRKMRWFDENLNFLFRHGGHEFFG